MDCKAEELIVFVTFKEENPSLDTLVFITPLGEASFLITGLESSEEHTEESSPELPVADEFATILFRFTFLSLAADEI